MRPKLLSIFLLILFAPLVILGWLGARTARAEKDMLQQRYQKTLESGLRTTDSDIAGLFQERERSLSSMTKLSALTPDELRGLVRESPMINQFFVLDDRGELLYPDRNVALSSNEAAFLRRTERLWLRHDLIHTDSEEGAMSQQGWYTWYQGTGLNLIFWWRDDAGNIVGAELNRTRLVADIIAELPDTNLSETGAGGSIELLDSNGNVVYRWGEFVVSDGEEAFASIPLSPPLSPWRLKYYVPVEMELTRMFQGMEIQLLGGFAVLTVMLVGLSFYFYREQSRDLREAGQRVNFVNQVSHELKTPLTNIRMYAELLEENLDEADEQPRRYVDVIVSESQRLSRLIGNVLSFSRGQRNSLNLHASPAVVDDTLRSILQHFGPTLEKRGIRVAFDANAPNEIAFDQDALEQIVGNLLSNVEKYATDAGRVEVVSEQNEHGVAIVVRDDGPGVPARDRSRIFEAFYRVSNKLTDGVAGTGIGLSIARDLARLHGGNLILEDSEQGACFRLTLASIETASEEAS